MFCLQFIFYFLSVSRPVLTLSQMSSLHVDDVILSQLQAISQLFLPNPPSGEFCQVSELLSMKKMAADREKCLFGQNWAKIPRTYTLGHLQG